MQKEKRQEEEGLKRRGDGHTTFGELYDGARFILLQQGDKVIRETIMSTGVEIYVKLWEPVRWTKAYNKRWSVATKHPTALCLRKGTPASIPDDQEVQIIYH